MSYRFTFARRQLLGASCSATWPALAGASCSATWPALAGAEQLAEHRRSAPTTSPAPICATIGADLG